MKDQHFDSFSFYITEIKNGWIFAQADISGQAIDLANSYLGGLELPKTLVRITHALLTGSTSSEWLCWHGETSAQIWHIEKSDDQICLHIYEAGSSFGLPVCGYGLSRLASKTEPVITAVLDVVIFANSICESFKAYRYGEGFAQWQNSEFRDYFPEDEYKLLRIAMRNNVTR